jgi:hypothetical protein
MLIQKDQEVKLLKIGIESKVKALKDQLQVRKFLMPKDTFTLTYGNLNFSSCLYDTHVTFFEIQPQLYPS